VSQGRLDNRSELSDKLNLGCCPHWPDSELIIAAYQKWGDKCVNHLIGDWAFALWDQSQQHLLVARDATGNTALYWWRSANLFAFSTGIKGILAIPEVPKKPNAMFHASILTGITDAESSNSTAYEKIYRLEPGHLISINQARIDTCRWWEPEKLSNLPKLSTEEYYESFVELYKDAVLKRIRIKQGHVAATLSGGLDSSSVVALAAPQLVRLNQRLPAYVHTPFYEPSAVGDHRIGNEYPLAQLVAQKVGNTDAISLQSQNKFVLDGIRKSVEINDAPSTSPANHYWINDLIQTAYNDGARVLLTGQGGNSTVSYTGHGNLWPLIRAGKYTAAISAIQHENNGSLAALRHRLIKPTLMSIRDKWPFIHQELALGDLSNYSAINPELANQLKLSQIANTQKMTVTERTTLWRQGRQPHSGRGAARWMEYAAHYQLAINDPTRDQRVVEYCMQLPDEVFWANGTQKGLIRVGMKDLLPNEIINGRRKGLQSADLFHRLLAERNEIEETLTLFECTPLCNEWLNLPKMRQVFNNLNHSNGFARTVDVNYVLLQGLSTGLHLLRFS